VDRATRSVEALRPVDRGIGLLGLVSLDGTLFETILQRLRGESVCGNTASLPLVCCSLLGYQVEFPQSTYEFDVRFFGGATRGIDGHVVAGLGPRDSLGDVGISAALRPLVVNVQFPLPPCPATQGYKRSILL
jgi:hypothetical protein